MEKAKKGDRVKIHYRESTDEGVFFDSTTGMPPFEFTIGSGQAMPALEEGVVGMEEGEMKTIVVPMENAYGERDEGMVGIISKSMLDPGVVPKVGMIIQANTPEGEKKLRVTNVEGDKVTVDANSPLAGKEITFRIRLVEIVEE